MTVKYKRMYIPTKTITSGECEFSNNVSFHDARVAMLELLNKWNATMPGLWQYWLA